MNIKFEGFEELENKLNDMKDKVEKMDKDVRIPFGELFNEKFIKKYTRFNTFDELLENSGFKIESQEDFENLSEEELDRYIKEVTYFKDWKTMFKRASEIYMSNLLKL